MALRERDRRGKRCEVRHGYFRQHSVGRPLKCGSEQRRRRSESDFAPGREDGTCSLPRAASHHQHEHREREQDGGDGDDEPEISYVLSPVVRALHPHQLDNPAVTVMGPVVLVEIFFGISHGTAPNSARYPKFP